MTTDKDNEHVEALRVLLIIGTFVFICISIYAVVYQKQSFNALEYGSGLGSLLGGGGVGIGMKSNAEPEREFEDLNDPIMRR